MPDVTTGTAAREPRSSRARWPLFAAWSLLRKQRLSGGIFLEPDLLVFVEEPPVVHHDVERVLAAWRFPAEHVEGLAGRIGGCRPHRAAGGVERTGLADQHLALVPLGVVEL